MPSLPKIGLALALLAAVAGRSQAQALQVPPRETFTQLDANGDNVVEPGEVPEKARPAFERLLKLGDANKDGKLEAAEFRDLVQAMRAGAPADPGAGAGANLGVFSGNAMAKFKGMDKDGDGRVSRAEFPGRPQMFERVDANKDGFLEAKEVQALVAKAPASGTGPGAGQGQPGSRIMAMDKDGDGKVSRAEFSGAPALFDRLDADNDGSLSKDEAGQGPKVMLELLKAMDADGDGKISRDEFRGPPERFAQLDADKDGFVTMEEVRNAPPMTGLGAAAKKAAAKKKD